MTAANKSYRKYAHHIDPAPWTDREAAKAQRAVPVKVHIRRTELGGKRLLVASAHDLFAALADGDTARPGHPT